MKDMFKDTFAKLFKIDHLIENLTGYVETRVELIKIEVKEELAKSLAKAVAYLLIAFIAAVFIIFISTAAALGLAQALGNVAGFSIVAGVYLVATLILWILRDKLISKFEKRFEIMFRKKK